MSSPTPDVPSQSLEPALLTELLPKEDTTLETKEIEDSGKELFQLSKSLPWNKRFGKLGVIVAVSVIALIGIITVVILSTKKTPEWCEAFLKDPASNEEPLLRQICLESQCPFKVSLCSFYCPFGYASGEDDCPNACSCASKSVTYQVDISFDPPQLPGLLNDYDFLDDDGKGFSLYFGSASASKGLWLDNELNNRYTVPIRFNSDAYSETNKEYIRSRLGELSKYTCIDFRDRTTEKAYLSLHTRKRACSSYVGKVYQREQGISIPTNCLSSYNVEHEFTHALGFNHEQCRSDRDDYVLIHPENMKRQYLFNFQKLKSSDIYNLGLKFDMGSMMLYKSYFFTVTGRYTITDRNHRALSIRGLTELDVEGIRRLYQCTGNYPVISPISAANAQLYENGSAGYHWSGWSGAFGCGGCSDLVGYRERTCIGGHIEFCKKAHPREPSRQYLKCGILCYHAAVWEQWSAWSKCSRNQKTRTRACGTYVCEGYGFQAEPCLQRGVGWYEWEPWTGCTSCNSGTGMRTRKCNGGSVAGCTNFYRSVDSSQPTEQRPCSQLPCYDGTWGKWTEWTPKKCPVKCDGALVLRERKCSLPGRCLGRQSEGRWCNSIPCDAPPRWAEWTTVYWGCRRKHKRVIIKRRKCIPPPKKCVGDNAVIGGCGYRKFKWWLYSEDGKNSSIFVAPPSLSNPNVFCESGSNITWVFGDFNGDRVDDSICGRDGGTFELGVGDASKYVPKRGWVGEIGSCSGDVKLSSDFNGDGRDDVLCQDKRKKSLTVILSSDGNFQSQASFENTFCTDDNDDVLLLDTNGDGKTDIICHRRGTGFTQVYTMNL